MKTGVLPAVTTTVYRHIPRLPRRISEGMKHLDNRAILLQYFEVFKESVFV
jgi:hypothetical protein